MEILFESILEKLEVLLSKYTVIRPSTLGRGMGVDKTKILRISKAFPHYSLQFDVVTFFFSICSDQLYVKVAEVAKTTLKLHILFFALTVYILTTI